jgi:hypothetical protein
VPVSEVVLVKERKVSGGLDDALHQLGEGELVHRIACARDGLEFDGWITGASASSDESRIEYRNRLEPADFQPAPSSLAQLAKVVICDSCVLTKGQS